jgi:hypothetical protein
VTKRKIDGSAREWKRAAELHAHRAHGYGVVVGAAQACVSRDAVAASFQTLGQYRTALLKLLQTADGK